MLDATRLRDLRIVQAGGPARPKKRQGVLSTEGDVGVQRIVVILTATGVVWCMCLARAAAQVSIPGGVAGAGATAAAVPGGAAAAPPKTIWSFLGLSGKGKGQCRLKLCRSPVGQLLNNLLRPLSAMTGGIVPALCPPVPPVPPGGPGSAPDAGSAAAAIAADQKAAKERRAAVKFLANVDCQYWPEAEAALVAALRADKNECVRWEAAVSLSKGCCCTPTVRSALAIAAEGSDRDGNPAEKSWRVRQAAAQALARCEVLEPEPPAAARPERPMRPESPPPAAVAARRTRLALGVDAPPTYDIGTVDLAPVPTDGADATIIRVSHDEPARPAATPSTPGNNANRREERPPSASIRRGLIPRLIDSLRGSSSP